MTQPSIWNDFRTAELRAAGPGALLVASFLKYKANEIGFFRVELEEIASEVSMPMGEIESTLTALENIGFLRHHESTQTVWIVDHAILTLGKLHANNRKMIDQANSQFTAIPRDCTLRVDFLLQHACMLRLGSNDAN